MSEAFLPPKRLLLLIGAPGAGKSTLMAAALAGRPLVQYELPLPYMARGGIVELGAARGGRSGADALPHDAVGMVIPWLRAGSRRAVVVEGARLAHDRFIRDAIAAGYKVSLAFLDVPDELAAARRAERGSQQNESWVRGRISAARKLAADWRATVLDGRLPLDELAEDLRSAPIFMENP